VLENQLVLHKRTSAQSKRKRQLGRPGVDGGIILRWILMEVGCESVHWIDLAQDRDRWQALFVMNLRVFIKCRGFLDELRIGWLLRTALLHGVSK